MRFYVYPCDSTGTDLLLLVKPIPKRKISKERMEQIIHGIAIHPNVQSISCHSRQIDEMPTLLLHVRYFDQPEPLQVLKGMKDIFLKIGDPVIVQNGREIIYSYFLSSAEFEKVIDSIRSVFGTSSVSARIEPIKDMAKYESKDPNFITNLLSDEYDKDRADYLKRDTAALLLASSKRGTTTSLAEAIIKVAHQKSGRRHS
jgi:hypothetical protein